MEDIRSLFLFDEDLVYLNHGSFGATPKPIFEEYQKWQLELERSSIQFMTKTAVRELEKCRGILSDFIHCDKDDVVFTTNPSWAINIVAKSFDMKPGDEILATNLEYGALDFTWDYYCEKAGAKYIRQEISLPIQSKEQIIEDFWKGYSEKTKAVYISQLTSATALILPVHEICAEAKKRGLITIVDGAHVPGHIPLDLRTLDADIYTGALHKWMLAPKGSSFLYIKREMQAQYDPLMISWGYKAESDRPQFQEYNEYQGTRDLGAFLATPACFQFREAYNWAARTAECRQRIRKVYPELCAIVGTEPICPVSDEFLGQMCSVPVNCPDPIGLKEVLFEKYTIEIPVFAFNGDVYVRISIQPYTSEADVEALKTALKELVAEGKWIQHKMTV